MIRLAIAALCVAYSAAMAHESCNPDNGLCQKYDSVCCNEKDCRPLKSDQVEQTATGYRVTVDGKTWDFRYGHHQHSTDARFHICIYGEGRAVLQFNGRPCFYAPPPGA